jgi:uncharacterized membrane protein YkvA (DUF1232 family)
MSNNDHADQYSESSFWDKVVGSFKRAGRALIMQSLKLYYAGVSPSTPLWAKSMVFGALGYFISPIDAVPDVIPIVGFSDDAVVLSGAIAAVATYISDSIIEQAKSKLNDIAG